MNAYKKKTPKRSAAASRRSVQARRVLIRVFRAFNLFGYIDIRRAVQTLPFLLFLCALAMLFIANGYYTERTLRAIDKTGKEIKELKSEFITTKSDLMTESKQSKVAEAVSTLGLEESREAPARIAVVRPETE